MSQRTFKTKAGAARYIAKQLDSRNTEQINQALDSAMADGIVGMDNGDFRSFTMLDIEYEDGTFTVSAAETEGMSGTVTGIDLAADSRLDAFI